MRKYATGTHVLVEEIAFETGATPREVVWTKNKARLYRYRRADGDGKRRAVPILLIYGFVLKPYILDLVPGNGHDSAEQPNLTFHVKQFVDAMAPVNFLLSNPAALRRIVETGGTSLIDGARNLIPLIPASSRRYSEAKR